MKIRIKRFDKNIPLPQRHSAGAAAFDLTARETVSIPAQSVGYVPVNVAVETPHGHFLFIAARSSTHKRGLMLANGVGIGDPDFSGDADEYRLALYNFTAAPVIVERGDRIAQGTFVKFIETEWEEVDLFGSDSRGGFGTTGR